MKTRIRNTNVAGLFYPADPQELDHLVRSYLGGDSQRLTGRIKALVAPHAGYQYSGAIAGTAFATLAPTSDTISRVVLLGPSHRIPFHGLAYSDADAFATPLGQVPIDKDGLSSLRGLPFVNQLEAAFDGEHCLEVELPFLQTQLDSFTLIPLLVGDADADMVATVLERLWGGDETLIVVSSDLSHYQAYDSAKRTDSHTSEAIEALRPEAIDHNCACGCYPLNGLLTAAKRHGLRAETLDLRNSGDTAGPKDQVVGYGAYAFH